MPGAWQVTGEGEVPPAPPPPPPTFPAHGLHHVPQGPVSQEKVALITWSAVLSAEFKGITGTQCPGGAGGGRAQALPATPRAPTVHRVCLAKVIQGLE